MASETSASPNLPPQRTVIEVIYPQERGELGIRGNHAPLSWEHTSPAALRDGDRHLFVLDLPEGKILEFKLVRNEEDWAKGLNYKIHAGEHLHLEPVFDRAHSQLLDAETLHVGYAKLTYQVLLPPSYDEQPRKRYPVLYAQDGQALWSTSQDPYGVWNLDTTLDQLYELGALSELIVVAIHTGERRLERLSPVPDHRHGGGEADEHLHLIANHLRPLINERFRTKPEREHTGLLGSSMGGLFAFHAAWSRPDLFGKTACLSSSFWWGNREAIRRVQQGLAPSPRPVLYLDSGAAKSALEKDASARDGFRHTQAMFRALVGCGYTPGVDLHRLTFPGATHDATAWAARVALPLQLLFPVELHEPAPVALEQAASDEIEPLALSAPASEAAPPA